MGRIQYFLLFIRFLLDHVDTTTLVHIAIKADKHYCYLQ